MAAGLFFPGMPVARDFTAACANCRLGLSSLPCWLGRLGVDGLLNLGRLPLRVFSIGKYAFQKKLPCWAAIVVTAQVDRASGALGTLTLRVAGLGTPDSEP